MKKFTDDQVRSRYSDIKALLNKNSSSVGIEPTTPRLEVWCATIAPRRLSDILLSSLDQKYSILFQKSICKEN